MNSIFLDDTNFLETYIYILNANPPARSFAVSNLDAKIIFANQTYLDFIELPLADVIGKSILELNSFIADYTTEIRVMTQKAMAQDDHVRWILQVTHNNCTVWLDCYLLRLRNPYTNNLVGMVSNINWAHMRNPILNLFQTIDKKVFLVQDIVSKSSVKLSEHEHEILALLAMGKSYKEVAYILGEIRNQKFKPATIATVTYRKIFPKFKVHTLSELIKVSTYYGILDTIPNSFL